MSNPVAHSNPVADSGIELYQQIFTDPRPCELCVGSPLETGPTFTDRETGVRYCLPCLEKAVAAIEAEEHAEREHTARQAACFQRLAC